MLLNCKNNSGLNHLLKAHEAEYWINIFFMHSKIQPNFLALMCQIHSSSSFTTNFTYCVQIGQIIKIRHNAAPAVGAAEIIRGRFANVGEIRRLQTKHQQTLRDRRRKRSVREESRAVLSVLCVFELALEALQGSVKVQ